VKGSFQEPEGQVHDTVHEVLSRFSGIVLGPAESSVEYERDAVCHVDAKMQITVGKGGKQLLNEGH